MLCRGEVLLEDKVQGKLVWLGEVKVAQLELGTYVGETYGCAGPHIQNSYLLYYAQHQQYRHRMFQQSPVPLIIITVL